MTTSDPRFDAAWRAWSSEEPPASLDAAITAAARREVGARPQKTGTREAMADRRRWWPLAAAATVAAIAIGILQLTMPDQVGAPTSDTTIVSDVPAPASRPAPQMPTTPSRSEEPKPEAGNALRAGQAPTRADSPRRQTPAPESRAGEARVKDRAPLPVPEWIALIRRLRDEGKSADAAKELAAFRVAHTDHEKLLPLDLRDWRPPEK